MSQDSADLRGGVNLNVAEANGSGINEIQTITTNGATAGTFKLSFTDPVGGFTRTTGDLPFDATSGEVQTALENLTSVGSGNVSVTGAVGGPWQVEFVADYAATDVPLILMDGTNLDTGFVVFSSTVQETVPGNPGGPTNEQQSITILPAGGATGGTFILSINTPQTGSITTGPIAFDADGAGVDSALASAGAG